MAKKKMRVDRGRHKVQVPPPDRRCGGRKTDGSRCASNGTQRGVDGRLFCRKHV